MSTAQRTQNDEYMSTSIGGAGEVEHRDQVPVADFACVNLLANLQSAGALSGHLLQWM